MFPIAKFRKALAWASGDSWLELADAEAICITLLDQVRVSRPLIIRPYCVGH
jgi:hypothetical protein